MSLSTYTLDRENEDATLMSSLIPQLSTKSTTHHTVNVQTTIINLQGYHGRVRTSQRADKAASFRADYNNSVFPPVGELMMDSDVKSSLSFIIRQVLNRFLPTTKCPTRLWMSLSAFFPLNLRFVSAFIIITWTPDGLRLVMENLSLSGCTRSLKMSSRLRLRCTWAEGWNVGLVKETAAVHVLFFRDAGSGNRFRTMMTLPC